FPFRRRLTTTLAALLLTVLFASAVWSQTAQPQSPPSQAGTAPQSSGQPSSSPPQSGNAGAVQVPGAGAAVQDKQSGASQSSDQSEPETHVTKGEAKELFRSVDEILGWVSQDTGLPIEHKVKRNLITRQEVEKFVDKRMKDDKDEKRLEQSRLVLQKFGLLPPNYDLHAEFLRLMGEQVAAYYDPKTKSVNLLDWVQLDAQKPILSHELTHALQDQKVGIEKWELAGAKDDSTPLPDPQEYVAEEAQSARQCVTEGQGMAVMFDYMLAPLGKNLLTAPGIVSAMQAGMADSKDSPVFAQAPMFLKESLLMPYTFGLDFVRTVMANKGKEAAFAGILENPPIDTRQIMQPETYLLHQVVAPPPIPDFDQMVAPAYQRFDFGSMGEFDVYLLAKQYGANDAPNYYRHWRGGYYFAARAKTAPKDQIAMLYYARWDSPEAAHDFAKLYADYLPKRYKKAVLQAPSAADAKGPRSLYVFDTNEGKATIEIVGNDLLIMEGFDDTVTQRARDVLLFRASLPAPSAKGKS
ncbi:MAG: hypothetical protein WAM65_06635, partial [Candidatus Korobacteraceae bacterium]